MNRQMWQRAEQLASQPYQTMTFLDKTTDGQPVFVALIPELPGCHTHGDTIDEALELLNEVKVEFIYFMLEDALMVPEPQLLNTGKRINLGDYLDNVVERVAQPPEPRGVFLTSEV